jgi:hypothetical protein
MKRNMALALSSGLVVAAGFAVPAAAAQPEPGPVCAAFNAGTIEEVVAAGVAANGDKLHYAGTTVEEYIATFTAGLNERIDRNDDQVVCWDYSPTQLASPKHDANPSNPYGFQWFVLIDNNNYGLSR